MFDLKARFVSDLVGNQNCWFSHVQAQISKHTYLKYKILEYKASTLMLKKINIKTLILIIVKVNHIPKRVVVTNLCFYRI